MRSHILKLAFVVALFMVSSTAFAIHYQGIEIRLSTETSQGVKSVNIELWAYIMYQNPITQLGVEVSQDSIQMDYVVLNVDTSYMVDIPGNNQFSAMYKLSGSYTPSTPSGYLYVFCQADFRMSYVNSPLPGRIYGWAKINLDADDISKSINLAPDIFYASSYDTLAHCKAYFNPNADSVHYKLAHPFSRIGHQPQPGYNYPLGADSNYIHIHPQTGMVTLKTGLDGWYSWLIKASFYQYDSLAQQYVHLTDIHREIPLALIDTVNMQFNIGKATPSLPDQNGVPVAPVLSYQTRIITLPYSNLLPGSDFKVYGGPFHKDRNNSSYVVNASGNTADVEFSWTPTHFFARERPYYAIVRLEQGNFFADHLIGYKVINAVNVPENLPQNLVVVYPNPSSGRVVIRFDKQLREPATVEIHDNHGKKVFEDTVANGQESLEIQTNLPAGLYFIQVRNRVEVATFKWVVK